MIERVPTLSPPDRNTRKPRVPLPAGAHNCHAHAFEPQRRYPYLPSAAYIMPSASTDDYAEMLTTIGCSRAVILPPSVHGNGHGATLDALRSGKFEFCAVAVPAPAATDCEPEDMHTTRVRGVRVNLASLTNGLGIADVPRLAERITPLGGHLQFNLDLDKVPELEDHVHTLPVDVVSDHLGLSRPAEGVAGT